LIYPSKRENNKKRKIVYNNSEVYERLFNYSLIKEKMLSNLSNKYLIDEEEKYTFIPQINTRDSNYYAYIQSLYEIPHKNLQNNSEQNGQKIITLNKIKNLKNNLGKYSNQDINNKYLQYMENKNISKNKSNNYSDIGVKTFNMKNEFRAKLRNPLPFSNNINNNYNSSYYLIF
jgi:hypothetical protein